MVSDSLANSKVKGCVMAQRSQSKPLVVVLDPDRDIMRLVVKQLREALPPLPHLMIRGFTNADKAWRYVREEKSREPYLAVTDTIGVIPSARSFIRKFRGTYPKTKVVLFSGRATDEDVVRLQNVDGLVHRYVPKDDGFEKLIKVAGDCFVEYEKEPVLRSMRLYLSKCRKPDTPFTAIANREYSLKDVYWEIVKETEVGLLMEEAWRTLQVKSMLREKEANNA